MLGLLLLLGAPARAETSCVIYQLNEIIRNGHHNGNVFRTIRSLTAYLETLGDPFSHSLHALTAKDHWVDLGCGDACAISDYQHGFAKETSAGARVTGITYKYERKKRDVNVLPGNYFEEVPMGKIGKAKLITDVYGVLAYTTTFSADLQKAINLLEPNGELYVYLGDLGELEQSTVELIDGNKVGLVDWIKKIPGVEVEIAGKTLRLRKLGVRPVHLPVLNLESAETPPGPHYKDWPVHIRHFRETALPYLGR